MTEMKREVMMSFSLGEDTDVKCPECGFPAERMEARVAISMKLDDPVRVTNAATATFVGTTNSMTMQPCGCEIRRQ